MRPMSDRAAPASGVADVRSPSRLPSPSASSSPARRRTGTPRRCDRPRLQVAAPGIVPGAPAVRASTAADPAVEVDRESRQGNVHFGAGGEREGVGLACGDVRLACVDKRRHLRPRPRAAAGARCLGEVRGNTHGERVVPRAAAVRIYNDLVIARIQRTAPGIVPRAAAVRAAIPGGRRARAAGIEDRVSGHSLRVGAAQSLVAAGASTAELMQAGRWTDAATATRYAANEPAGRGAVARYFEDEDE